MTKVITKGGNPIFGRQILEKGQYDEWIASTEEQPAFVDFADKGLRPISELSKDETRKAELEEAYKKYAEGKGRPLESTKRFALQDGDKIALKAHNDRYLGHSTLGSGASIMPTLGEIGGLSTFTVRVLSDDRIAFLADIGL